MRAMRLAPVCLVAASSLFVTGAARAEPARLPARDKAAHFAVSFGVTAVAYGLAAELFEPVAVRAAAGGGVALLAGVAKELVDLVGAGDPDWLDLAFDALGVATSLLVAIAIDALVRRARRERAPPSLAAAGY
jgi:hypothetical protein